MKRSESIANFAEAFAKFQAEVTDPKMDESTEYITKSGKRINFKYASLKEIMKTIRPVLAKHGICIMQEPKMDGNKVSITTILLHSSGEFVEFEPTIMNAISPMAQEIGSAITYGRRYSVSAVLGLGAEDDDDGNAAQDGVENKSKKTEETTEHSGVYASEKQVGLIKHLIAKTKVDVNSVLNRYRAANLESLSVEQASDAIKILKKQAGEE